MELDRFAREVMEEASRLGFDDCELLATRYRRLNYRITNRELNPELSQGITGVGIRILKDSKLGSLPLTVLSRSELSRGLKKVRGALKPVPISRFAEISELPQLKLYDPEIVELLDHPGRIKELAQEMIDGTWSSAQGRLETLEGSLTTVEEERLIATLKSKSPAMARRTLFSSFLEVNSRDFDAITSRALPELSRVIELGPELIKALPKEERAPEELGVKGKEVEVILHPIILETLLRLLLGEQVYASSAQQGLSRYRVGEQVATEKITLIDDGTTDYLGYSFPTDDEGVSSRRTPVIEQGIFKTYLYDRVSGVREGRDSTGSGIRRPVLIEDEHEAPVRCGLRNLILEPGSTPLRELIQEVKQGLLVKYLLGIHTANRTTGDFSNTVYVGQLIEDGEIRAVAAPGRWGLKGNFLEVLKSIESLSRERFNTGSALLPWVCTRLWVT